jgi:very-short-patch-repair endonuclease
MEKSVKAQQLRKSQTNAEAKLWRELRNRNFFGLKFRRQFVFEKYILDFVCLEKRLVIELDGGQHNFDKNAKKDFERDKLLKQNNFKVLRFWNFEINENFENILEKIAREAEVL